jgi:GNAT superfamily N-acetyltransferase
MQLQYREVLASDAGLPEEWRDLLRRAAVRIWTAIEGSIQVGHCEGVPATGEIFGIQVLHGYRRRGIGKQLLHLAIDALRASGCTRIWVDAPRDRALAAHHFYAALGWKPTGEVTGEEPYLREILELP